MAAVFQPTVFQNQNSGVVLQKVFQVTDAPVSTAAMTLPVHRWKRRMGG